MSITSDAHDTASSPSRINFMPRREPVRACLFSVHIICKKALPFFGRAYFYALFDGWLAAYN